VRFPGTPARWCASAARCARASRRATSRYERRDAFYRRAKEEGFRSRAAYKLEDLLRRVGPLRRGARVLELGCWPGSWLQVLAERVGAQGRVVGIDLVALEPLPAPVLTLVGDFCEPAAREAIAAALGGRADLLLCDAAPKLSGIPDVDRGAMQELHEAALELCEALLAENGSLVMKAFPGAEADAIRARLRARFARVAEVRPEGKRSTSKEFYWVAGPDPSGRSRRRSMR
jgi:23S rRNA (uridine2552-2'-O)-methyltransferase